MKKNFKTFILGVVIGAMCVSIPAMADVIWEKIDVVRNHMTVMIDGEKLEADNFLYLDTTYVPIRAVAEGLGRNVIYKDGVAYIEEKFAAEFAGENVALGNGFSATTDEITAYKNMYAKDPSMANATDEQLHKTAIENISSYKALSALAAENNIYVGQEFYNNFSNVMAYMELNYGSKEAMYAAMEDAGYSYEMYKRYQETEYLYSKLLESAAFAATDAEIAQYYADNADAFPYDGVQAQHILISTMDKNGAAITDSAKLKEIEKKANDIYKEAIGGADFNALISKYGEDPGMMSNPEGYIFTTGEMVEQFETAAFALKDGEISKPVQSVYGWHIIKKIKTHKVQPLDDELKAYISSNVTGQKIHAAVDAILAN
ncbi:MAG: peptidylprolyl isomerase [Clostridia bacterium]|nr:peptidylprolyl isomerase [Clostridia bacterium]